MNNEKYGKLISDKEYLTGITKKAQAKIDAAQESRSDDYGSDGMKDEILDYLDSLYILPEDIDCIFSELEF